MIRIKMLTEEFIRQCHMSFTEGKVWEYINEKIFEKVQQWKPEDLLIKAKSWEWWPPPHLWIKDTWKLQKYTTK